MFIDSLYHLGRGVVWILCKLLLRMEIRGQKNLPKRGGVILAPNHASYLDIPCLCVASARRIYFIARQELFDYPLLNPLMRFFGAISIARGRADFSAIRKVLKQLDQKKVICLFPEGTRSPDGTISETGESGAGFLSVKAGVPIVPVYLHGTHKALPKGERWLKPHPVQIRFGDPIYPEKEIRDSSMKERYHWLTQRMIQTLKELQREAERGR